LRGRVHVDRDDVGARDHHLVHLLLAEGEDRMDHVALLDVEHALLLAGLDDRLDVLLADERALAWVRPEGGGHDPGEEEEHRDEREELEHLDGREVAHPALPHPARPLATPAALDEVLDDLRTADRVQRRLAHREERQQQDERELDEEELQTVHYVFFPTFLIARAGTPTASIPGATSF